jgi:hypothetical protein
MILTCLHIARFTPVFFYLVILSSWSLLVCHVHFAKYMLPNCQFYIAKSTFPSHQLHVVNVTLRSCQVHLTLWTARNELQAAQKLKCFRVAQCLNFFLDCPKPLPLIFSFFTCPTPVLPPSFPYLPLSCPLFFSLDRSLKIERSPFKIQGTHFLSLFLFWLDGSLKFSTSPFKI